MKRVMFMATVCVLAVTVPLSAQDTSIVRTTGSGFIVDFENQPIRAVISALADAGGLNYQIGQIGNLNATLRLTTPVTREQIPEVLKSVVEQNGLRLNVTEGGLYTIDRAPQAGRGGPPAVPVNPLEMSVYVLNLKHLNNQVLAQILTGVFSTGGRGGNINFNVNQGRQNQAGRGGAAGGAGGARGGGGGGGGGGGRGGGGDDDADQQLSALTAAVQNQLLLDPANAITAIYDPAIIGELVRQQTTPQEARILNAVLQGQGGGGRGGGRGGDQGAGAAGAQIGALLGTLQAVQAGGAAAQQQQQQQPVIVPTSGTNQIIVRSTQADFQIISALVAAIDLRPLQVLIEVTIVEVTRTADLNFGVSGSGSYTKQGDTDPRATATLARPTAFDNARDFVLELAGGRGTVEFSVALNALATRGDVTVVSLPVIFAQNNLQAQLIVGEQRPFVSNTSLIPTDNGIVNQVIQYRDVATTLLITPTINADGYVNMDVDQSIQNVTAEVQLDAPVISSRRAVTSLFVRSGQTAVIGGLSSKSTSKTRTGIPILSKIPIIGAIFGATRNSDLHTEMYLFLTPHVIQTDMETDRLTQAVKAGSELVKDVPLRQLIPQPDPAIRVIIPPDTATITRIPRIVPVDTSAASRGRGGRVDTLPVGRGRGRGGVDTLGARVDTLPGGRGRVDTLSARRSPPATASSSLNNVQSNKGALRK